MTQLDVVIARPPKVAPIVGVVVDLEVTVDPVAAAERIRGAAEALRAAGLALVLLPADVGVKTRRRKRRNGKGTQK